MARVPLIDTDDHPELLDLVERIRGQRRGKVINVYRTLLHSPAVAERWFNYINQIRFGTEIDGRLREIVIIRVGYQVGSAYVIRQHVPRLAVPEGVSEAECEALRDWRGSEMFDARERAALAYVDVMLCTKPLYDAVFPALREHFDDRQIVELTMMVGAYIAHARVLDALQVDLETDP
jgi:alkylhydroperoxidase family enzyme